MPGYNPGGASSGNMGHGGNSPGRDGGTGALDGVSGRTNREAKQAQERKAKQAQVKERKAFVQGRIQKNKDRVRGLQKARGGNTTVGNHSYGPGDLFAGMLESIGSALSLGFVDPEINGKDYSFSKGRPVAKEPGLHFNPVAGLATALGGPLGTFGVKGLQQATGTVPGTYDEDGNVNTAMSMFGGKKGSKMAGGGVSLGDPLGKDESTSLGGTVGKSSPGNGVGRDGGGGGSQRSTARKQWAAKTGSRANAGTGIPSRQSRSANFLSSDDDLFSLYRHMLSGYFKGVKVKN
ncbi:MAG: hypothetical protein GY862_01375 [Gammaproteobacteria bacterium]|nr:hypothetical protein [Gammaproteobacteria bacterium]